MDDKLKVFVDKLHTEIQGAIESNIKARAECIDKHFGEKGVLGFVEMCNGKIVALRGIDEFIDELYKEMVKEV